jgi:hypothetical protein
MRRSSCRRFSRSSGKSRRSLVVCRTAGKPDVQIGTQQRWLGAGACETTIHSPIRLCHLSEMVGQGDAMKNTKSSYHGHRFPASIISRTWFAGISALSSACVTSRNCGSSAASLSVTNQSGAGAINSAPASRIESSVTRRKPRSRWHLDEGFASLRGDANVLWHAVDPTHSRIWPTPIPSRNTP